MMIGQDMSCLRVFRTIKRIGCLCLICGLFFFLEYNGTEESE